MKDSNAMTFTKPFGTLYTLLSPRRKILYGVTLLFVLTGRACHGLYGYP